MEINSRIQADIYKGMVAGSFPFSEKMNIEESASMLARDVLHEDLIHIIARVIQGRVFYIAVASREISSTPDFKCPLASAIPSVEGHRGPGCYRVDIEGYSAALFADSEQFKLIVNFKREVDLEVARYNGACFDVTHDAGTPLRSERWAYRSLTSETSKQISKASLVAIAASAVLYLASSAVSGYMSSGLQRHAEDLSAQTQEAIDQISLAQPIAKKLTRLTAISEVIVRTGGWIDGYRYTAKTGEKFAVSLPGWTTPDVIKVLGEGVQTELKPADNQIWAIKKDREGKTIDGVGPDQVQVKSSSTEKSN